MDKIFKAVKQDGAFFFTLSILNLPIFLQAFVDNKDFLPTTEKFFDFAHQFFCVATIIFAATLAINFFLAKRKKLKKFLQQILTVIFATLFAAEFFYLSKVKSALKADMIEIFLENLFAPEVLIGMILFVIFLSSAYRTFKKFLSQCLQKKLNA